MQAAIKTRAAFRTAYYRPVLDYKLCLDSLDSTGSTLRLQGGDVPREMAGSFLAVADSLYLISSVSPGQGYTDLALLPPIDLFSRPRPYVAPAEGTTLGAFVAGELAAGWRDLADGVYAMPYMALRAADELPFVPPETDANGYYVMTDYLRMLRRRYGLVAKWTVDGNSLQILLHVPARGSHTLIAGDGHTTLSVNTYSRTAVAKVTTVQPVDTGDVDENGEKIYRTDAVDWYLASDGTVSAQAPVSRAFGDWQVITVAAKKDAQEAAQAIFDKNSETHKVEFYTDFRPQVGDAFRLRLPSGRVFSGTITAVTKARGDGRWLCQAGSLAVTLTDKVRQTGSGSSAAGRSAGSTGQLYAVGDVFITTREGDPAVLLGYGAWDRIQGRFLFAADGTRPVNSRGGSASHQITAEELPADVSVLDTSRVFARSEGAASGSGQIQVRSYDIPLTTKALGDGASFDLLPPYVALYVWVRKA